MNPRGVTFRSLIPWLVVYGVCCTCCLAEKLSPDQKAPPFARGSGGLILKAPFEGEQGNVRPVSNSVDGVEREETEMLKLVDGELVRTVMGHFAYNSPEGLPIFVKYVADENGNRASFKFGSGSSGSAALQLGKGGQGTRGDGQAGQGQGSRDGSAGQGPKSSTYLPPKNVDRSYLPPQ